MGQHDAVGERLNKLNEPLVAAGCLDGHLKCPQAAEPGLDALRLVAMQRLTLDDHSLASLLHHDAQTDNLLMEVDADVLHGSLLVWKLLENCAGSNVRRGSPHRFTTFKELPKRGATSVS